MEQWSVEAMRISDRKTLLRCTLYIPNVAKVYTSFIGFLCTERLRFLNALILRDYKITFVLFQIGMFLAVIFHRAERMERLANPDRFGEAA